jgi:acyl-homoserine-lactone acylase
VSITSSGGRSTIRAILTGSSIVVLLFSLTVSLASSNHSAATRNVSATIRYTEYGVPHVTAHDYPSLGFGTGYAAAKDNVCLIAQGVVTLRGERSRHFGPDGPTDQSLSSADTNLVSDLYFTGINDSRVVERLMAQPSPQGPRAEVRDLSRGWAAGYNAYLRDGEIRDPSCKGARWLSPITELDVFRRIYALTLLRGTGTVSGQILNTGPSVESSEQNAQTRTTAARELADPGNAGTGSNAFALGGRATTTGRGLLLANPHFPWHSGLRFWQVQQTIPGRYDVSGASILGLPVVSIGYNSGFAWSHTTGTGMPAAVIELTLAPGDPTSYLVDGRREAMTRRSVTVQTLRPDGSLEPVTATQWLTRHGPMLKAAEGLDLPWTTETGYALLDPNTSNLRLANTSYELGTARTTDDAVRVLRSTQGIPWVDTVAADSRGRTLFAQIQVLPNVTDDLAERCNTALGKQVFPESGLAVLDGARSSCIPAPASLSPDRYPSMQRPDYVTNSNDSYWLANPAQPLEGFDRVIGTERSPLSLRTRNGLVSVQGQIAGGKVSRADLQRLALSNRSHAAALAAGATVRMCDEMKLGAACDVLRNWDRAFDTGSRGALLFGRFWQNLGSGEVWRTPFDPADPVRTPRDLNTASPAVRKALTDAVRDLGKAGVPLDAPLRDHQYVERNGVRIPIGGTGGQGVLNVIEAEWTDGEGYTEVEFGSTYLQAVSFDGDPCPDAQTLLTYAQSADPTSPHFADQTGLFSRKQWVPARFCEQDIAASPALEVVHVSGSALTG